MSENEGNNTGRARKILAYNLIFRSYRNLYQFSQNEPISTETWGNEGCNKVKQLQRVSLRDQTNLTELETHKLDRPFDDIFDSVIVCANIEVETQLEEQDQGRFLFV